MKALILKEINSFFSTLMGYLVIGFFLIINALLLFVLDTDYNILNAGYNDLSLFFKLAPLVLIILIPALTMKSISEEKRTGTFEILATKPLTFSEIVWAKFFGALAVIFIAILPTVSYVFILNSYGLGTESLDFGSTLGSFLGILLLASVYCSLGILSSAFSKNQLVCLLFAIALCLFFYFGFAELAQLFSVSFLSKLGIQEHFKSISRGVIDSRDFIYFISFVLFINFSTVQLLKKQSRL